MSVTTPIIKQGESANYKVAVTAQDGNPIVLADADGIEAETRVGDILSRRYTTEDPLPDDYYKITISETNKLSVYISRTDSLNFAPSKQVILNVLVKMPEGSTPLYYNLQYVIASTATGTLQNSSL